MKAARLRLVPVLLAVSGLLVPGPGGAQQPPETQSGGSDPHAHHHGAQAASPADQPDGAADSMALPARKLTPEERVIQGEFLLDYIRKAAPPRELFDRYLPRLGAQPLLETLEERNRYCHEEAHELGRAIFARSHDFAASVAECGSRCSSGCLHGVLKEAFGSRPLEELRGELPKLCQTAGKVGPGTCAHGLGHALMLVAGNDVGKAVAACGGFADPVLEMYCSGGAYMELFDHPELYQARRAADPLYPCVQNRFPATCFRYLAPKLLVEYRSDLARLAATCRSLPAQQRRGCFLGYGWTQAVNVNRRPDLFAGVCPREPVEDQTMCIEGAIEFLGVFDRPAAERACATLEGDAAATCLAAAREGNYRLQKPSMPLYLEP